MSLIGNVLANLESKLRTAVPTLPAGTDGVEYAWRPLHEIKPQELPHAFLWNVAERPERLRFRQLRVEVSLSGMIVRLDSTYEQALLDYEAFLALIEAAPTLAGLLDQSHVSLDSVESTEGGNTYGVVFTFTGQKVLT